MKNKKQTSKELGSIAGKALRDPNSSEIKKTLAGSVLSQTSSTKETGKEMETIASHVLASTKYSKETKSFAANLVSQANAKR